MAIIVGSARADEYGKYQGGKPGDQKQLSSHDDRSGEVSQQNFYVHSKGWYILRAKDVITRRKIAEAMQIACNNVNIGYSQSDRGGILKHGVNTDVPTNADCSSLVRACIKYATGRDVGNFTTYNEAKTLENSGMFEKRVKYVSTKATPLYTGDVLVTCSKGHTVVVTQGKSSDSASQSESKPSDSNKIEYYPKYKGTSLSIVLALREVGERDYSFAHRMKIAEANGIKAYQGNADQNIKLVTLIKNGKLIKA